MTIGIRNLKETKGVPSNYLALGILIWVQNFAKQVFQYAAFLRALLWIIFTCISSIFSECFLCFEDLNRVTRNASVNEVNQVDMC